MKICKIAIRRIRKNSKARELDRVVVENLMVDIAKIGLKQPVGLVRLPGMGRYYEAVGGGHRIEAIRRLGHKTIAAFVMKKADAERFRLSENLVRSELTALERLESLATYATRYAVPTGTVQPRDRGISATSKACQASRRLVQQALFVANNLSSDARTEIEGTRLKNNSAAILRIAKKATREEQLNAIEETLKRRPRLPQRLKDAARDGSNSEKQPAQIQIVDAARKLEWEGSPLRARLKGSDETTRRLFLAFIQDDLCPDWAEAVKNDDEW